MMDMRQNQPSAIKRPHNHHLLQEEEAFDYIAFLKLPEVESYELFFGWKPH